MKRFFALMLAVIVAAAMFLFAGCALTENVPAEGTGTDAGDATDMTAVVAQVGDEVVTMAEYKDMFDMYNSYYAQMGYDFTSDEAMLADFQDFIMEMLLGEKAVIYQAKLAGMDQLTDEESVTLEEQCDQAVNDMLDYYRSMAEEEKAADDSVDVEARIIELVEAESTQYTGGAKDYDEYLEWLKQETRDNYLYTKMQESVYADISVNDEEIAKWLTDKLAEVGTTYTDDPGLYKDDQEYYEMYGGDPIVTAPEGYSRIYNILLTSESELPEEYNTNAARMTEIEADYGAKAFEDAVSGKNENKAELAGLVTEYNGLKAQNDALLDAQLTDAKAKADEAYAKLESGEEFAAVMKEYTQDANFTGFEVFMQKGMLISTEFISSTDWSDEVKAEFAKLSQGEYSGVFRDEEGYHIIYYVGDEPAGDRTVADFETELKELVLAQKQSDEWSVLLSEWLGDKSVTRNEELIRSMGK